MAVTRQLCSLCDEPLSDRAIHVLTPELRDPGRYAAVYWCLETEQHVVVPFGWADDMRGSVRWVREFLRRQGGESPVLGPIAELVFEVAPPTARKARRPNWIADLRRLWRNLRRQL